MIPYTITRVCPSSMYTHSENVSIEYSVCENVSEFIHNVTRHIVEFMYEFCSEKYGHGIDIVSYSDFCSQWWTKQECNMNNFYIFEVHFFQNNTWDTLNITNYHHKIYDDYVKYKLSQD
jgi:hypothetical protein